MCLSVFIYFYCLGRLFVRDCKHKPCAAHRWRFIADFTTVRHDHMVNNRQTQSCTVGFAHRHEGLEQRVDDLFWHTRPIIFHHEAYLIIDRFNLQFNLAATLCFNRIYRVIHQVLEHPHKTLGINIDLILGFFNFLSDLVHGRTTLWGAKHKYDLRYHILDKSEEVESKLFGLTWSLILLIWFIWLLKEYFSV